MRRLRHGQVDDFRLFWGTIVGWGKYRTGCEEGFTKQALKDVEVGFEDGENPRHFVTISFVTSPRARTQT